MTLLHWVPGRRQDRDALRAFECTHKARNRRRAGGWEVEHRAKYELRVQSMIRKSMKPCGEPGRTTLLGWDRDGDLGGVVSYRQVPDAASVRIDVVAVAMRYRGRGSGWAREALNTALDFITADADGDGFSVVKVAASIHEDNRPSQRLFELAGFDQTDIEPDGYQSWAQDILIGGTAF